MTSIQVPREWEQFDLTSMAGTIIVIGQTDTGKSTFVRWLVGRLSRHHDQVGWLDADVGQSTLGVPTTMNLAVVSRAPSSLPAPDDTFFVGATSPRGHMLPVVVGAHRLQARARAAGASALVVDTTGLVAPGMGGGALKHWKIALLEPTTIIAFQRHGELVHILTPLVRDSRRKVHVMPVPRAVNRRFPEERRRRRHAQFRRYFADAAPLTINYNRLPVYNVERAARGRLLALQDEHGFAVALGVITHMSTREMTILTPVRDATRVAGLHIGSLNLNPETGEENWH